MEWMELKNAHNIVAVKPLNETDGGSSVRRWLSSACHQEHHNLDCDESSIEGKE
jgi:hypothetical protein